MKKLLIICGPTGAGKTDLAFSLAKQFNGELISADSRQVYRGMDIGTGKDIGKNSKIKTQNSKLQIKTQKFTVGYREKDGIPIWLVDVVDPDYPFNVGEYVSLAHIVNDHLWSQGKLPIVVGGTGLYIRSLLSPPETIKVPPNEELRKKLEILDRDQLAVRLRKLDSKKWENMNTSDKKNPRRLIRAIEVALVKSKITPPHPSSLRPFFSQDDVYMIGLTASYELLDQRIDQRVENRMKQGMLDEIQTLLKSGYHWHLPSFSSLGYQEWKAYFIYKQKNKFNPDRLQQLSKEAVELWKLHERQYARRQMTWFKKEKNLTWFDCAESSFKEKIEERVEKWYTGHYAIQNRNLS